MKKIVIVGLIFSAVGCKSSKNGHKCDAYGSTVDTTRYDITQGVLENNEKYSTYHVIRIK